MKIFHSQSLILIAIMLSFVFTVTVQEKETEIRKKTNTENMHLLQDYFTQNPEKLKNINTQKVVIQKPVQEPIQQQIKKASSSSSFSFVKSLNNYPTLINSKFPKLPQLQQQKKSVQQRLDELKEIRERKVHDINNNIQVMAQISARKKLAAQKNMRI
jgi:hypothetical protein